MNANLSGLLPASLLALTLSGSKYSTFVKRLLDSADFPVDALADLNSSENLTVSQILTLVHMTSSTGSCEISEKLQVKLTRFFVSCTSVNDKQVAYLAFSLLFQDKPAPVMIYNTLLKDLSSRNEAVIGYALQFIFSRGFDAELLDSVLTVVFDSLIKSDHVSVRRDAISFLHQISLISTARSDMMAKVMRAALGDQHWSVMAASLDHFCASTFLQASDAKLYAATFTHLLSNIFDLPVYGSVHAPLVQLKLLRVMRSLVSLGLDQGDFDSMVDCVVSNYIGLRGNLEALSIILETFRFFQVVFAIPSPNGISSRSSRQIREFALGDLHQFLSSKNHNLRYFGVDLLKISRHIDTSIILEYQNLIVAVLEDKDDLGLCFEVLDLLFDIVNAENVEFVLRKALHLLSLEKAFSVVGRIVDVLFLFQVEVAFQYDVICTLLRLDLGFKQAQQCLSGFVARLDASELHDYLDKIMILLLELDSSVLTASFTKVMQSHMDKISKTLTMEQMLRLFDYSFKRPNDLDALQCCISIYCALSLLHFESPLLARLANTLTAALFDFANKTRNIVERKECLDMLELMNARDWILPSLLRSPPAAVFDVDKYIDTFTTSILSAEESQGESRFERDLEDWQLMKKRLNSVLNVRPYERTESVYSGMQQRSRMSSSGSGRASAIFGGGDVATEGGMLENDEALHETAIGFAELLAGKSTRWTYGSIPKEEEVEIQNLSPELQPPKESSSLLFKGVH